MQFDVVIEIPRGSRNKYEYDHEQQQGERGPKPVVSLQDDRALNHDRQGENLAGADEGG